MQKAILQTDGTLTSDQIAECIRIHDNTKYYENEKYFEAENPTIIDKDDKDDGIPDNRIPVPYGRKISLTTKNYVFSKPIRYVSDDKDYLKDIQNVHYYNKIDSKNRKLGLKLVIHGKAYKLFYTDSVDKETMLKFSILDNNTIIPVYNYGIEPELIAAIRYYDRTEDGKTATIVEVYCKTKIMYYIKTDKVMEYDSEKPHGFNGVPLVVYGDDYEMGVFDGVKSIIDGIDLIVSTNLNEIQRFELAYLILKGQKLNEDDVDDTKKKGIFELDKESTIEYLIKKIDTEFHGSVLDFLVDQVHKQSHVPDFASKEFAAESGVALLYKLLDLENIASEFEAQFIEGEERSIDLINSILYRENSLSKFDFFKENNKKRIEIKMDRNLPEDVISKMEIAVKMNEVGVSKKTILENMPMIKNADEEIKKIEEEGKKEFANFLEAQPEQEIVQ